MVSASANAEPVGRVTAHVWGDPAASVPSVRTGVADTLGGDTRLSYKSLAELMPEPADDADADLKSADSELEQGDMAFSGMEIAPAKEHLGKAVALYTDRAAELVKRDGSSQKLKTAWVLLAKVSFFDGDTSAARLALRHCLTLDPKLVFSTSVFPQQMKKLVTEVRAAYDAGKTGGVTVESVPPGAALTLDGVERPEKTPTTLTLPNGPHDVRLQLAGHKRVNEVVEVPSANGSTKVSLALPEAPSRAEGLLAQGAGLDDAVAPPQLKDAADKLGVDLIMFVRVAPAAPGHVGLRGWLYDARRQKVLKRASREPSAEDREVKLDAGFLAHDLTTGVGVHGTVEPPPRKDTFADKWHRFQTSKWFWPVVGAVAGAVVVGTAVGVGVGVSEQRRHVDDDVVSATVLTGGH
jgi:hypothetical protein